jgi:hypothetical protein
MAAAAESLSQQQWTQDALDALLPSVEASPWGALESAGEVLGNAHLFEHVHGRERVLIVARPVKCDHGTRCDIVGLRSLGDRFTAAALDRSLVRIAREGYGADVLAMNTRHEHLVRSCQAQGWTRTGFIVIKPVNLQ